MPVLDAPAYPVVDGIAVADVDGENQTCACGNDSYAADWYAADSEGAITFDSSGSTNPDEHTLCPACGRLYRNTDLFTGTAAAVARYDTHSPAYLAALEQYERDAYGKDRS
ncbi:hypothetical protein GCM10010988_40430 [Cnuibacter physcomitrellae]|uniref:Uncharacterized protein n=1 Tax=Cnuibacter physcomitrellae TaxID=1619308 RepID=A0A1X9LWG6_9MICO|nr:hypothetical protein [Cnuibacter physcomitrellae]ARJ07639.1 hypothetical protein B5808_19875 [Cnuibacter physcomitrellae]GGI42716.1 hypothetical protein GCM10010988_40430 [Cnuibacter physcomitrellae]